MEPVQHYGVCETVPEFRYRAFVGKKIVYHIYEGHEKIIASFESEYEATRFRKEVERKRSAVCTGEYMVFREFEYMLNERALYTVMPVDVLPSVAVSPS